jgi:hypothetical protein
MFKWIQEGEEMIIEYSVEELECILKELITKKVWIEIEGMEISAIHWKDYNNPSGIIFEIIKK